MGTYRFGTIEVRTAERRVLVEGTPAALGARAFDLLVALIENRDRVMTKDELLALVWPGVVVEENNLQVQVSTLRKIMGAEAVTTLPGRGYRFTLMPDAEGGRAAPSPQAFGHNLPAELNSFVGREAEIAEVHRLLGQTRLVTLTGVGGTGKTRLSLHVAAEALPLYPEGVWLVELAPVADERHVVHAIASTLGIAEGELAAQVAGRKLLLVLDNCEHLLSGCAQVARRLLQAAPGVRILASSREPLHVAGESTYRVPPLARAQAIELFVERARAADPAFEPADQGASVAEICRRLDGLPLAIELAAARVRALSVAKVAERLDDRFKLLSGGDRTAMPRQQTLRASIEWSYDLLSASERALLNRLAVFAGGCTLESAEAVCGGGEVEAVQSVIELLANLVDKSLVSLDAKGERYHLLETVREYALEQLAACGDLDAVREKQLRHYLDLAAEARAGIIGPDQAAWLHRLDAELENILAVQAWSAKAPEPAELGLRLISSLKQYWLSRGHTMLARRVMLDALARTAPRSRPRARTLLDAGQMAYFMGLYPEACAELEEAVAIARELGDPGIIVPALQPLGLACLARGEVGAAGRHLEESAALARAGGKPRSIAATLIALAHFKRMQRDFAAAEPLYEQALACMRELDDRESAGTTLLNLAMTSIERSSVPAARARLVEALAIAEDTRSKYVGQCALETCSGLASQSGAFEPCARFYGCAESEAARTRMPRDPVDQAFLQPRLAAAREALGGERFAELELAGRALAYDDGLRQARAWVEGLPA